MITKMSAAEVTKISMILLRDELLKLGIKPIQNAKAKLILVVHDELILEATEDIIEQCAVLQKECMEKAGEVICKKVKIKALPVIADKWVH